jgi:predicted hydrocarbon binding protein
MENKYNQWIEGFKKTLSEKVGDKLSTDIVKNCNNCGNVSNDKEMAICVRNLMERFDKKVPEQVKRSRVMETLGSYCVSPMLDKIIEIRKSTNDKQELIKGLNKLYGAEFFKINDDQIISQLEQCVCHFGVATSSEPISPTYCQCSLGYMKTLFSTLFDRPIQVELVESVLTGGKSCQFVAYLD